MLRLFFLRKHGPLESLRPRVTEDYLQGEAVIMVTVFPCA